MNPDELRRQPKAVEFIKSFFDADKPVAVICHGPWTIVEAGLADLSNAGAEWIDREVVTDGNLVSSRKPDDSAARRRHDMACPFRKPAQHRTTTAVRDTLAG